jgi:hypothetical protein
VSERSAQGDIARDNIPVFSPRLDEILAAMIEGKIPNVGRFCGYCYTPVSKGAVACAHCGTSTSDYETLDKIPPEVFGLYRRMRKREALIVNSFAFAGLGLGLVLFIVLVGVAVYRYEQSLWMLAAATAVFIVGGRIFAGLLGGWIGDSIGYDFARRRLVDEWREYARERERARDVQNAAPGPAAVEARQG